MRLSRFFFFIFIFNTIHFVANSQLVGTPYVVKAIPHPIIYSFEATSTTINVGTTIFLTPNFLLGTAEINNGVGVVESLRGYPVTPNVTTTYILTVTNSIGKSITQTLTIYVNTLSITLQPMDATVNTNIFNSLSVNATASGIITFQWYNSNGPMTDYRSSIYRNNVAGSYYVIVTSTLNGVSKSITSNTATVTHNNITILTQPTNGMFGTGGAYEISVVASGSGSLNYQWYKGNNAITNANASSYSATIEGAYHVEVSSTLNGVVNMFRSNGIYIAENKVTITSGPVNTYATIGNNASLMPTYSYLGGAILTYQWFNDAGAINGATEPILTTNMTGNYYLMINSSLNGTIGVATSTTATVTMVNPPSISSLTPASYGIGLGSSTTLTPVFSDGTGVIMPGNIIVTSGNAINISPTVNTRYTLTVTNQAGTNASLYTNIVITKGIFTATGSLNVDRPFNYGFLLSNGKVLIANSGWSGNATAELYDYTTGTFSITGNLNTGNRYQSAAVALAGKDKVIFTGGSSSSAAEMYDVSTGQFINLPNMISKRANHKATLLNDGRVFISGGHDGTNYLSTTEIYDPVANTFTLKAPMSIKRAFHSSILLNDGTVLIVGGYNSSAYVNTAVVYNPTTNTYSSTSNSMSEPRGYPSLTLLNNGKVLIVGGANQRSGGLQPTYTAELYDPVAKTFSSLPALPTWMYYNTATLQPDGLVLITGGQATYGGVEKIEALLFDPNTNQFLTGITPMTTGRAWHSATLLPNGKTLIVGGYSTGSARTAEIYDPN